MANIFPQLRPGTVVVNPMDGAVHMDKLTSVLAEALDRIVGSADESCPDDMASNLRRHMDDLQRLLAAAPPLTQLLAMPDEEKRAQTLAYHAWVDDVADAGHAMISALSGELHRILSDHMKEVRRAARRAALESRMREASKASGVAK